MAAIQILSQELPLIRSEKKASLQVNVAEVTIDSDVEQDNKFEFGLSRQAIDPQIYVDGCQVQVPLSEEDARLCIHVGYQSARRTWELKAEHFETRNTEWQSHVDALVGDIAKELGVEEETPGFHAELDKMVLYEQGATFSINDETPGLVGKMVVVLSSPHSGAAVRVQEGTSSTTVDASCTSLWWYVYIFRISRNKLLTISQRPSGSTAEMLPVERGIRWALTYNLVLDDAEQKVPSKL